MKFYAMRDLAVRIFPYNWYARQHLDISRSFFLGGGKGEGGVVKKLFCYDLYRGCTYAECVVFHSIHF